MVSKSYACTNVPVLMECVWSAPALGIPASFMVSGAGIGLWASVEAVIEKLPSIYAPSFQTELPVSLLDGFTRAFLLCSLIPPMVVGHPMEAVATSPWSLLVTSLVCYLLSTLRRGTILTQPLD